MRALAVTPGQARSACLLDVPEPGPEMGSLLVQTLAIGICGTDVAIVSGRYPWLSALITRRVPLADWQDALERRPHDIKVIIEFGAHA